MDIGPGTRLDSYEVLTLLGRGGMGEVWLARDLELNRRVAIKLLPPHVTNDRDRISLFRQEARAASALNHPNVCTIYALGAAEDGRLFIAMEYIEGRTLRARLSRRPLPIREAVDMAVQMAAGLGAAHAAGVIHRDVKPENVMIRADGLVKVLDFGVAKLDPEFAQREIDLTTHTAPSDRIVAGTIAYMSPEQTAGEPFDARTDIFSLGAVLYEMAAGCAPFTGASAAVVYDGILNRAPVSPMRLNPAVPSRLQQVILKALEKNPDLRYQTASELRTDLIRLERGSDGRDDAVSGTTGTDTRAGGPRQWLQRAAIGVALAAVVVTVGARGFQRLRSLLFRPEPQEIQLTTNSSENPVNAAAISPDGRYVAYADQTGIYLRTIDSGEVQPLAAPEITEVNRVRWFPDGGKLVVSGKSVDSGRLAIWSVALIGVTQRRLRDDGLEAVASLDGSQIAFVDAERTHVWVMGANGEEPHPVVSGGPADALYLPDWSVDGLGFGRVRQITESPGVVRADVSAEIRDREGHTRVVLMDRGLKAGVRLPDGRFLYSLVGDINANRDSSLWESRVTGGSSGLEHARHLLDWPGAVTLSEFTVPADGTRMVFLKRSAQKDVYIAGLGPDGAPVDPRRLTLDDRDDFLTNWTPDGRALFFTSNRNGTRDIFRQSIDSRVAEAVVSGADEENGPTAVSSDGAWLYYVVTPKGRMPTPAAGNVVMRTPASGGARETLADGARNHVVLCARPPSNVCVFAERNGAELSIDAFDPAHGRGRRIANTSVVSAGPVEISPDGSRVAIQMAPEGRMRVLSLQGDPPRDIDIRSRRLDGSLFSWSLDSAGWYLSSTTSVYPTGTDLLYVDLEGHVRIVWHQNVRDWVSAIPAPGGSHIALSQTSTVSNVWILKGF